MRDVPSNNRCSECNVASKFETYCVAIKQPQQAVSSVYERLGQHDKKGWVSLLHSLKVWLQMHHMVGTHSMSGTEADSNKFGFGSKAESNPIIFWYTI